jgi:hypothetical protein
MTPEHVEGMWRRINELAGTNPAEAARTKQDHYLSVLVAIANGNAQPDPASLARAVLRQVAESGPTADQAEPAAKASSGPGWPRDTQPAGQSSTDGAGRQWVTDLTGRAWIEADGLWYPSHPETMSAEEAELAETRRQASQRLQRYRQEG